MNYDKDWIVVAMVLFSSILLGFMLKKIFANTKSPKGKPNHLVSYPIIITTSIISSFGLITRNYMYIISSILVLYFLIKEIQESKKHYPYQIVLSVFVGLLPTLFYVMYKENLFSKLNDWRKTDQEKLNQKLEENNITVLDTGKDDRQDAFQEENNTLDLEQYRNSPSSNFSF